MTTPSPGPSTGICKAELVRGPARSGGPWKTVEVLELATLGWVHWHNHERLHGYLDDVPPVEFESAFYAVHADHELPVGINQALSGHAESRTRAHRRAPRGAAD